MGSVCGILLPDSCLSLRKKPAVSPKYKLKQGGPLDGAGEAGKK